jgi:hypothetical protein
MTSWNKDIPMTEEAKRKNEITRQAKRESITYVEKVCNKCSETKSLEDFPLRKANIDNRHNSCKGCEGERKKKYKQTSEQWWLGEIKRKFGITQIDYNALLESQNRSCAICNIHLDEYKGVYGKGKKVERFSIDHCHSTGKIRGLLCFNCNLMLGHAKDSQETLASAIMYLQS